MKKQTNRILCSRPRFRKTRKTRTTMFDLIEALNEVVEEGEKGLVPQIVLHMANSGLLKVVR